MKNFAALLVITVLAMSGCDGQRPLPPHAALPTQAGLAQLFFSARTTQYDLKTAIACFTTYIGELSILGECYGQNYTKCFEDSQVSHRQANEESRPQRLQIEGTSQNVCQAMQACNNMNKTLDMFNCHTDLGTNNSKIVYVISGNASEYAMVLQERIRIIDVAFNKCNRQAERHYVDGVAESYKYLHLCLDGKVKPRPLRPRPTTTSTTTTTTTTTTTAAPTTLATPPVPLPPSAPRTEDPRAIQEQFAQLLNLLN
jgi:hypothetical protein